MAFLFGVSCGLVIGVVVGIVWMMKVLGPRPFVSQGDIMYDMHPGTFMGYWWWWLVLGLLTIAGYCMARVLIDMIIEAIKED